MINGIILFKKNLFLIMLKIQVFILYWVYWYTIFWRFYKLIIDIQLNSIFFFNLIHHLSGNGLLKIIIDRTSQEIINECINSYICSINYDTYISYYKNS